MAEVAMHVKGSPNGFFLDTIVEIMRGEQEKILDTLTDGSYAAYAALKLLFYPDLGAVG
jgi:hypothetical protein